MLQIGEFSRICQVSVKTLHSQDYLDQKLGKYQTEIIRYDAAVIAHEVETAREVQRDMERQARAELRKQKDFS